MCGLFGFVVGWSDLCAVGGLIVCDYYVVCVCGLFVWICLCVICLCVCVVGWCVVDLVVRGMESCAVVGAERGCWAVRSCHQRQNNLNYLINIVACRIV